jgi:hypothetical protein
LLAFRFLALAKTKIMNINEFKIGTPVVRIEASEGIGDRSYIGERLILKAIANGCAYFEICEDDFMSKATGATEMKLRLDWFSNGWDYYQEINKINNDVNAQIKFNLKVEIKKAVENEDYELLAELKAVFDKAVSNEC